MTKPGEEKVADKRSEEELEVSKETLADLDAPEEEARDVKGGSAASQQGCSL